MKVIFKYDKDDKYLGAHTEPDNYKLIDGETETAPVFTLLPTTEQQMLAQLTLQVATNKANQDKFNAQLLLNQATAKAETEVK
ncbi:hypothetical protein EFN57_09795 [Leuconostoc citreum]|uniref:hypothetical protein n=1 Tax=Leuconostoc citreum TaxID=33964 RepID=UPI0021A8E9E3|nr:hypothetical protein [Leuconostoc citreum]MCT3055826.1 hypothetical protein [Leuconostoc citreum]MCT3063228.1 hypothetical protein [Leuconostoc citreum]